MALIAGDVHVRARQRKFRKGIVIETGIGPGRSGMAHGAIRWKSSLNVVRIGCALVILGVAGIAIGWRAGELSIDVALVAGDADVAAG